MTSQKNIQKVTKIGGRRIIRVQRESTIEEKNRYANNIIKKTFTKGIRPLGKTSLVTFRQNDDVITFENPNVRAIIDAKGNHICYIVEGKNTKMNINDTVNIKGTDNDVEEEV